MKRLLSRENVLAVLLCLIVLLLIVMLSDSTPQWIYQGIPSQTAPCYSRVDRHLVRGQHQGGSTNARAQDGGCHLGPIRPSVHG